MGEYQVIARKWRPQCFADVVGQEHVVRTLRNAIGSGRIAHAYLFVGPRGIGKTTLARIFAKALNCENPVNGEPCCKCASCQELAAERSLDVMEIDAASRNSTVDMRELAENALLRYEDYLRILLLMQSRETLAMRSMDIIERSLRKEDAEFQMDACIGRAYVISEFYDSHDKRYETSGSIQYY